MPSSHYPAMTVLCFDCGLGINHVLVPVIEQSGREVFAREVWNDIFEPLRTLPNSGSVLIVQYTAFGREI